MGACVCMYVFVCMCLYVCVCMKTDRIEQILTECIGDNTDRIEVEFEFHQFVFKYQRNVDPKLVIKKKCFLFFFVFVLLKCLLWLCSFVCVPLCSFIKKTQNKTKNKKTHGAELHNGF